jgi:hypothetical protein
VKEGMMPRNANIIEEIENSKDQALAGHKCEKPPSDMTTTETTDLLLHGIKAKVSVDSFTARLYYIVYASFSTTCDHFADPESVPPLRSDPPYSKSSQPYYAWLENAGVSD